MKNALIIAFFFVFNASYSQLNLSNVLKGDLGTLTPVKGEPNTNMTDNNGKKTGLWIFENKSKYIKVETNYNNGLSSGIESIYRFGKLESQTEYKKGLKHGIEKWFYKNGNLKWEQSWREGFQHGNYISYYKNGRIEVIYNFVNNIRDGYTKFLSKSGELEKEIYIVKGKKQWEKVYAHKKVTQYINWSSFQQKNWEEFYDKKGNRIIKVEYNPETLLINGGVIKVTRYNKTGQQTVEDYPQGNKSFNPKTKKVEPCFNCK